jgi:hypothetical protein
MGLPPCVCPRGALKLKDNGSHDAGTRGNPHDFGPRFAALCLAMQLEPRRRRQRVTGLVVRMPPTRLAVGGTGRAGRGLWAAEVATVRCAGNEAQPLKE